MHESLLLEIETDILVLLLVLEVERKIYRSLFDRGFVAGVVLSQLNMRVKALQEQVISGQLPPKPQQLPLPLELRWNQWRLNWFEKLLPNSSWVQRWRSQQIAGQ
jgi:hypothetical protein